jgi:hypothetical protein
MRFTPPRLQATWAAFKHQLHADPHWKPLILYLGKIRRHPSRWAPVWAHLSDDSIALGRGLGCGEVEVDVVVLNQRAATVDALITAGVRPLDKADKPGNQVWSLSILRGVVI